MVGLRGRRFLCRECDFVSCCVLGGGIEAREEEEMLILVE